MDFGIGCELVHPSVTMVQILRAVGLMAAIIAAFRRALGDIVDYISRVITNLITNKR
mgnify:CR=1 FL=1